jgi:hypothetical protein
LRVGTALGLVVTSDISNVRLGGCLQGESASCRGHIMGVCRLVAFRLRGLVTLLWDQVENTLLKFHFS